jgi:hypothetical protein
VAGFDLTTHSSILHGGRQRRYHDHILYLHMYYLSLLNTHVLPTIHLCIIYTYIYAAHSLHIVCQLYVHIFIFKCNQQTEQFTHRLRSIAEQMLPPVFFFLLHLFSFLFTCFIYITWPSLTFNDICSCKN